MDLTELWYHVNIQNKGKEREKVKMNNCDFISEWIVNDYIYLYKVKAA